MRAAVCRQWGGPKLLRIEELPDPELPAAHVRIAVDAAGVAFQDTLMIAGKYQTKPEFPVCPGNEICGRVVELGSGVSDLAIDDRVVAMLVSGGYAEQAVVPAGAAVKIPDRMSDAEGAALCMAYGTAHQGLVDRAQLKAGEYLLVRGASGGVGLAAVQIGAAIGAQVIAAASTPERRDFAVANGARHAIDSRHPQFRDAFYALTGGRGADVVFDTVGSDFREQALRVIARRGRIMIVGFAGGEIPQIPAHYILNKFCSVIGVAWGRSFYDREPENYRKTLQSLVALYESGKIKPHIARTVPLERAGDAMADLIANRTEGRTVIQMRNTKA